MRTINEFVANVQLRNATTTVIIRRRKTNVQDDQNVADEGRRVDMVMSSRGRQRNSFLSFFLNLLRQLN